MISPKLENLGEWKMLWQHILPALGRRTPLGDDCGWLELGDGKVLLISTDSLAEDSHYRKRWMSPEDLAVKALRTALSDVAAMGGADRLATVVALGVSKKTPVSHVEQFIHALKTEARRLKCDILGGDMVESQGKEFINVTVLGIAEKAKLLLRSQVRPGETLWLTGPMGLSKAGLEALQAGLETDFSRLVLTHRRPPLLFREGTLLSTRNLSRAAMDTSDSLACSLLWLARLSRLSLQVNLRQFPVPADLVRWARERRRPLADYILFGGEDYQILFSSGSSRRIMARHLPGAYPIGAALRGPFGVTVSDLDGREFMLSEDSLGYQAFR
ncbi:MAG: thiamine-phosphate kinase [Elusimicrobiota bacterium]